MTGVVGCTEPFTQPDVVESTVFPLTNPPAQASPGEVADKVDHPADSHFFADRALYMGDKDGYRYVHVRDMFGCLTFLGEQTYAIKADQWPVEHPMAFTEDATRWQDVRWMASSGLPGVQPTVLLSATPTFPLGAPPDQSQPLAPLPGNPDSDASRLPAPTSLPAQNWPTPASLTQPSTAPASQP